MKHESVMLNEAVDVLEVRPGGRYVDGTLGRAGHTREIIRRGGTVLGIDRDDDALREVGEIEGLKAVKGTHGNLKEIANENGWNEVDGVLLDLGVSSPQLDDAGRGFSFLREGPLDMRMDRQQDLTAATVVNESDAEELTCYFRSWGEEPQAWRIAKAIEQRVRESGGFTTTTELADFIEKVVGRHNGRHPATRVFQALRMAVNGEEYELRAALEDGLDLLKSGGRMAVITFESITDRIVKRFFAAHIGRMVSLQAGGSRWEGFLPRARLPKRAMKPSAEEIERNPRARSAHLRVIEKI